MKTTEEKVALLEQFDFGLERWFAGKHDADLRKALNEMAPTAQALVKEARCNKVHYPDTATDDWRANHSKCRPIRHDF